MTLAEIAQLMADELRRLPCRVDHSKEPCKKCEALELHAAYIAIVQVPKAPPKGEKP